MKINYCGHIFSENGLRQHFNNSVRCPICRYDIREYSNSENGIKYQLIEEKIIENNNIEINSDSIKDFAIKMIKNQMATYGQKDPDEKELNSILQRILSNQEEVKRISNQIISEKLLNIYKEKVSKKKQKISYEKYIEIAYKKK